MNEAERKGIKKGREEGRKEGIEEGRKEGIEKGIKEGIEKGEKNKAMEIAKSLINLGLDKEAISKSTGLDLGEIEKLMN